MSEGGLGTAGLVQLATEPVDGWRPIVRVNWFGPLGQLLGHVAQSVHLPLRGVKLRR